MARLFRTRSSLTWRCSCPAGSAGGLAFFLGSVYTARNPVTGSGGRLSFGVRRLDARSFPMVSEQRKRFTLTPGQWYAAEFIGDEFSGGADYRSHSAIRVDRVTPASSGNRDFDLAFYHANYPEGVRSKSCSLQILERSERFLLARSVEHTPVRLILIYDISWQWLRSHFDIQQPSLSDDVGRWLSNHA